MKSGVAALLLVATLSGRGWGILQVDVNAELVPENCHDELSAVLHLYQNPTPFPATDFLGPDGFPLMLHLLFDYDQQLTGGAVDQVDLQAGSVLQSWVPAPFTVFYGQGPGFPVDGQFAPFPSCATGIEGGAPGTAGNMSLSLFPNPANPATRVQLETLVPAQIRLRVVDLQGRQVAILHQGELSAGRHGFQWSDPAQATGLYLVVLEGNDQILVSRLLVLK